NTSMPTPALPMSPSIRRIPRCCMQLLISGAGPGGDSTAADRAALCGRPPMAATPGPSSKGRAGPSRRMASMAASPSQFVRRSQTSYTRRLKQAPAVEPAAARPPKADPLAVDVAVRPANLLPEHLSAPRLPELRLQVLQVVKALRPAVLVGPVSEEAVVVDGA